MVDGKPECEFLSDVTTTGDGLQILVLLVEVLNFIPYRDQPVETR
jgi:hypothetical protein